MGITSADRSAAVLRTLNSALAGMAAAIPEPRLAGPLGYFADAAGWAVQSLQSDARTAASEKVIEELVGEGRRVLDKTGYATPVDASGEPGGILEALVLASTTDVPEARELLDRLLTVLAYVETGQLATGEEVPGEPAASTGLTGAQVEAYLQQRFGPADVAVESVTTIGGGYSKHTILVTAKVGTELQEIVLRQVPPGQPDATLAPEYAVLRHVWSPDLPIAEPLWLEPSDVLGGPFFASRRAIGNTYGTVEGAQTSVPESFCEDLSAFLARLHSTDATEVPDAPVPPMRTAAEIRAAVDQMADKATAASGRLSPRLAAVLAWLRANIPDRTTASVVHGDVGLHNALADGGRLTAVLDWERAHLGDPVEDLAYLRPSIEPIFPWDDFLDRYVTNGGTRPDATTEHFYTVWQDTWRHIECLRLGEDFLASGTVPTLIAGYVLGPRFLASALDSAFGRHP